MKKFWKFLAVTAVAAGLVPYKVEKGEDGKITAAKALFWEFSRTPDNADTEPADEPVYHCVPTAENSTPPAEPQQ